VRALVILLAVGLLAATAWYACGRRFFEIDACLDRGGRWDYEREVCVLEP
jgi:hypothetical protein